MEILLSKAAFERLVAHLLDLEESKHNIIEQFFVEPSEERNDFQKFVSTYIEKVNLLLKNAGKSESSDNSLPFVTIGSEVVVEDLETNDIIKFNIVNPFQAGIGGTDISSISPAGKSLLLQKAGDIVKVDAPGGVFHYKIKSVRLIDNPD